MAALLHLYDTLDAHFGHEPHWWPITTDNPLFETLLGAILVQQTRWEAVEAAVARLVAAGLFSAQALAEADPAEVAPLLKPCAFYTQKAAGLQQICAYLMQHYRGDLGALLGRERSLVREELLSLPRIGRETADTIMLYAGEHPLFVVDAYARRLFGRLNLFPDLDCARVPYDTLQARVEQVVAAEVPREPLRFFYWHLHELIIEACIHHCLATSPRCFRPGAQRRNFVDPRKCADHCRTCSACPLSTGCPAAG